MHSYITSTVNSSVLKNTITPALVSAVSIYFQANNICVLNNNNYNRKHESKCRNKFVSTHLRGMGVSSG